MKLYKLFKSILDRDTAPVAVYEKHEYKDKETVGLYDFKKLRK